MSETIQRPSIGRIVLIKKNDGSDVGNGQKAAPAIVQTAHSGEPMMVNAHVFPDCGTPHNVTSIPHESVMGADYAGLVWSWPSRV